MSKLKSVLKQYMPTGLCQKSKKLFIQSVTRRIEQENFQPYEKGAYPAGLNLIGPFDSSTGLGQSFRLLEKAVSALDVPYVIINYENNTQNRIKDLQHTDKVTDHLQYGVNIWHINPADFAEAYAAFGKKSFDRRYNIAFWLWELEDFPDEWVPYIRCFDEIWTPSEFISAGIRKKTEKKVFTIPYCVSADADPDRYGRAYFHLPEDQFLFLMMYDVQSITERKNPEGVIRAFRKAFSPAQTDVGLVIKMNSADEDDMSMIRSMMNGYENVYLINENLEKIQVNSLIACADVFVSLHRAEGFGLVLAEAMLNRIPVIATDWSANTEFMNRDTACMVDFTLTELKKDIPPYKKGSRWADPDLEEAADYMKRLYAEDGYYQTMEEAGFRYVKEKLGMKHVKGLLEKRLQDIQNEK